MSSCFAGCDYSGRLEVAAARGILRQTGDLNIALRTAIVNYVWGKIEGLDRGAVLFCSYKMEQGRFVTPDGTRTFRELIYPPAGSYRGRGAQRELSMDA